MLLAISACFGSHSYKPVSLDTSNSPIGTSNYIWVDSTRIDPYYGDYRLINVQVWYPAESSKDFRQAAYIDKIEMLATELEDWSMEDIRTVGEFTVLGKMDLPLSSEWESYPVLLFSPSLGGLYQYYTHYAESLVKLGFVCVGINHLYESEFVLDPSYRVRPADHTFHDSLESLSIPEQITSDQFRAMKSLRSEVLANDMKFCLDMLSQINESEYSGRLNLSRVGAWGHSIGGAAASYASLIDPRVVAVSNLDGTPPTEVADKGIPVPFMFLEDLTDYKNHAGYKKQFDRRELFCRNGHADAYRILFDNINHNSFLDIHFRLARSSNEKQNALNFVNKSCEYLHSFFQAYLLDQSFVLEEIRTDTLEIFTFRKT